MLKYFCILFCLTLKDFTVSLGNASYPWPVLLCCHIADNAKQWMLLQADICVTCAISRRSVLWWHPSNENINALSCSWYCMSLILIHCAAVFIQGKRGLVGGGGVQNSGVGVKRKILPPHAFNSDPPQEFCTLPVFHLPWNSNGSLTTRQSNSTSTPL